MATVLPHVAATSRSFRRRRACSGCEPWEKLRRATSMPAVRREERTSGLSVAGPSVQTIFARRDWETSSESFRIMVIVVVYRHLQLPESKRRTTR